MTDTKPGKKQIVREIWGVSFIHRVANAGSFEGDKFYVGDDTHDIRPERHDLLGHGLRIAPKGSAGTSIFVPISNVARISYRERVDTSEPKD